MKELKLNSISEKKLSNDKLEMISGGQTHCCSCGCGCYNHEGISTSELLSLFQSAYLMDTR